MTATRLSVMTNYYDNLHITGVSTQEEAATCTLMVLHAADVAASTQDVVHIYSQDTDVLLLALSLAKNSTDHGHRRMSSHSCPKTFI